MNTFFNINVSSSIFSVVPYGRSLVAANGISDHILLVRQINIILIFVRLFVHSTEVMLVLHELATPKIIILHLAIHIMSCLYQFFAPLTFYSLLVLLLLVSLLGQFILFLFFDEVHYVHFFDVHTFPTPWRYLLPTRFSATPIVQFLHMSVNMLRAHIRIFIVPLRVVPHHLLLLLGVSTMPVGGGGVHAAISFHALVLATGIGVAAGL